jgi:hypothetical protein
MKKPTKNKDNNVAMDRGDIFYDTLYEATKQFFMTFAEKYFCETGDLSPLTTIEFDEIALKAAKEYLKFNAPKYYEKINF